MRYILLVMAIELSLCSNAQVQPKDRSLNSVQNRSVAGTSTGSSVADSVEADINAMFDNMRQNIETSFAKLILAKKQEKEQLQNMANKADPEIAKLKKELSRLNSMLNSIQQQLPMFTNRLDSLHRLVDLTGSLTPAKNQVQKSIDSLHTVQQSTQVSQALTNSQLQQLQQKKVNEENARIARIAAIPAEIAELEKQKQKLLGQLEESRIKALAEAQKIREEKSKQYSETLSRMRAEYNRVVQDSLRQINNRFMRLQ